MMEYTISVGGIRASLCSCVISTTCLKFRLCKASLGAECFVLVKLQESTSKGIDSLNALLVGCIPKSVPLSMSSSLYVVGIGTAFSSDDTRSCDIGCKIGGSLSSKETCISQGTTLEVDMIMLVDNSYVSLTSTLKISGIGHVYLYKNLERRNCLKSSQRNVLPMTPYTVLASFHQRVTFASTRRRARIYSVWPLNLLSKVRHLAKPLSM